jgi:virginiamycin B lyase
VDADRRMRCVAGWLICWLGGMASAGAQTANSLPKARGVDDASLQRPMTGLHALATFQVGGNPDWMAVGEDSLWVTSAARDEVVRLDAETNQVGKRVAISKPCSGLVTGFGSLWVPSCGAHELVRVDLKTDEVVARIAADPVNSEGGIAVGAGSVWIVTGPDGVLARVDPVTDGIVAKIKIPAGSYAVAYAEGSVWATSTAENVLARVDPMTNHVVSTTGVGKAPRFVTTGAGSVWTLNQGDGTISRVDARSGRLVATIDAGVSGQGGEIAYGDGTVWVTMRGFPITRIDSSTNRVTRQWKGKGGDSIRVGLGSVWLTDIEAGLVMRLDPARL